LRRIDDGTGIAALGNPPGIEKDDTVGDGTDDAEIM
jgi:hypothetical protein